MILVETRCTVHPSREANHRCPCCGKWMCPRCVEASPHDPYCSLTCRLRDGSRRRTRVVVELATAPLHGLWVFAVVVAVAVLALAGVGLLVSELSTDQQPVTEPPPPSLDAVALEETDAGWIARIQGPPGARVAVTDGSGTVRIIVLDDQGRGITGHLDPSDGRIAVEAAILGASETAAIEGIVGSSRTPAPSPTPSPLKPQSTSIARQIAPAVPVPPASPTTSPIEGAATDHGNRIAVEPLVWPTPPPGTAPKRIAIPIPPPPTAAPQASARRSGRPLRNAPPVLHHVADAGPVIALTFDGGSSSHRTVELLDLLQTLDLKVTLFVTGGFIRNQPALVRRAVLAGHEVGNHTDTHPRLTTYARNRRQDTIQGVNREFLVDELRRAEEAFRAATGRYMVPLWRGPYGEENRALRAWALEAGYLHVRWSSLGGKSLDTLDWVEDEHSSLYRDADEIARRLLAFPRLEGGIALLHLSTTRVEAPWTHLPDLVTALQARGITPIQVTTMLERSPTWAPWYERARVNHRRAYGEP